MLDLSEAFDTVKNDMHLHNPKEQGCQVGFFEANFLESGFFPRQLASKNVGWLFIEIWLFTGFFCAVDQC